MHHSSSPAAAALLADMRLVALGASPAERVERGTALLRSPGHRPLMHDSVHGISQTSCSALEWHQCYGQRSPLRTCCRRHLRVYRRHPGRRR